MDRDAQIMLGLIQQAGLTVERETFTDRTGKEVPTEKVLAESPVIVRGEELKRNARVMLSRADRSPQVAIEFGPEGAEKFYQFTRTHRGQYVGIVLDGEVLSAPIVQAPIRGAAVIQGEFATPREAQALANLLNAGPLPLTVKVEAVRVAPGRG